MPLLNQSPHAYKTLLRITGSVAIAVTIAGGLILMLVFAKSVDHKFQELRSTGQDNTVWTANQLEVDILRLQSVILSALAENSTEASLEQIRLRFDILYSRVGIVTRGVVGRDVAWVNTQQKFLEDLNIFLARSTPLIDATDPVLAASLTEMAQDVAQLHSQVRSFTMDVLHFFNEEADHQRDEIALVQSRLFLSVMLVSAIMLILIASLIWQMRRQRTAQAQLEQVAHFDDVTGLPNRTLFGRQLRAQLKDLSGRRKTEIFALVYIDLDNFKEVNDRFGHATGDQYLKKIGDRLKALVGMRGMPARLSGDEFVLLIRDITRPDKDQPIFKDLRHSLSTPVTIASVQIPVSASIGVTLHHPRDDIDADQLLRQADAAMYSAKRAGKNCITFFDSALERTLQAQSELIARFNQAIDTDELVLHYQPKVDILAQRVLGVEALLRWNHPEKGLLPPSQFLDIISLDAALLDKLTDWVLTRAIAQTAQLEITGLPLQVSVNVTISNHREAHSCALERLTSWPVRHPEITTGRILLEILESNVITDLEMMGSAMQTARQAGARFSLDDFGTGYSSLSYLKSLPLDEIKIDKSFVLDMLEVEDSRRIIMAILRLAEAFDLPVIAEGVETEAHAEMLLSLGCTRMQGFFVARPMPLSALIVWLAAKQSWISPAESPKN